MSKITEEFWALCLHANNTKGQDCGLDQLEPDLLNILNFTKLHADKREELAECFFGLVHDRTKGPFEILIFCMRELRWPEVRVEVEKRLEKSEDPRVHSVLNEILDVYEDEWDDADMYSYYS